MSRKYHSSRGVYTSHHRGEFNYPSADQDTRYVNKVSCIAVIVGLILVGLIILFLVKHSAGYALLAGTLVPGNPFGEGQQDDDTWKVIIGILILIVSLIAFPLSFIL